MNISTLRPTDFTRAAAYLITHYGEEAGERAANRAKALHQPEQSGAQAIWSMLAATVHAIETQWQIGPQ